MKSQLLDSLQENLHQIIAEAGANGISYKELRKKLNLVQPCISPAKRDAALDQLITAKRVQLKETANVMVPSAVVILLLHSDGGRLTIW